VTSNPFPPSEKKRKNHQGMIKTKTMARMRTAPSPRAAVPSANRVGAPGIQKAGCPSSPIAQ